MDFEVIRDKVWNAIEMRITMNQQAWELASATSNTQRMGELNMQLIGLVDAKCIADKALKDLMNSGLRCSTD